MISNMTTVLIIILWLFSLCVFTLIGYLKGTVKMIKQWECALKEWDKTLALAKEQQKTNEELFKIASAMEKELIEYKQKKIKNKWKKD